MPYVMYVSLQADDTILHFTMDPVTGKLTPQGKVALSGGPAPMAVDPQKRFLYVARRGAFIMSSLRMAPGTGELTHLGEVPLQSEPCYIATDRNGKFLLAAYYQAGMISIHPINAEGLAYGPPVEEFPTAIGAHCMQTDPSNRYVFVPHIAIKGPNTILQYRFDAQSGRLTPNTPDRITPERLDGPRHYCFHPSKDLLYFSNEQGCSVTVYAFNTANGTLSPLQTVSTLPADFRGQNSCSQIQITPSGKFLYAPNRGHHSLAGFAVDASSGLLTPIGHTMTETVPRAFSIDPTGTFVYAAGLESGRLAAYRIDQASGALQPLEVYPLGNRPMWVLIVRLD